ncbi:hypothetical protein G9A89_018288 [Geosiphon pyriformis]|nr:hypothetical protein G9A89_018288 [Geosiphon pyriformis]
MLSTTNFYHLDPKESEYIIVQKKFKQTLPSIQIYGILKLQMPKYLVERHETYKRETVGSLHQMFHGTSLLCDPQKILRQQELCSNSSCGTCGIVRYGNLLSKLRPNSPDSYLWFAEHASISLDYCKGPSLRKSSDLKAMFLTDVLVLNWLLLDGDSVNDEEFIATQNLFKQILAKFD